MVKPKTLRAFTDEEAQHVHTLLGIRVAHKMGWKFEEGDWASIYCRAKKIPNRGWSNLDIDVMHNNLGVEHKMLCIRSNDDLRQTCGTTKMHPAATRSIRIPALDSDANEAMRKILKQYGDLIDQRRSKVSETNNTGLPVDMRTGWLLWQASLRQFLYFEEEMLRPESRNYYAQWKERKGGTRKASKNLWVYEKETGKKRYSITTEAGAKIQPYFDIPPPDDPNLYLFTVIGEQIKIGYVRVWLTDATVRELERLLGSLDTDVVSDAILKAMTNAQEPLPEERLQHEKGRSLVIRADAYQRLTGMVSSAVNDEHAFQSLIEYLRG